MNIYNPHNLIIMTVLLVGLTACGSSSQPPQPIPTPPVSVETDEAEDPIPTSETGQSPPTPAVEALVTPSVTVLELWEGLPEAQTQALVADIKGFQAEFPQYKITLRHYDSTEDFISLLTSGEIKFDVALASPVLLNSLQAAKRVAPMSDFFPPSFIDNFAAVTMGGANTKRDDEFWGLADTAGFHLMLFYNRKFIDTPPANINDLSKLAERFSGGGRYGLAINSYEPLWLLPLLSSSGGWLVDETGRPTLNSPAMVEALTLYKSWHSPEGIASLTTHDEARTRFLNGQAVMMIDGDWAIDELADIRNVDLGVATLPAVSNTDETKQVTPLVMSRYWVVSQDTTGNRTLAASRFLEFITRPGRQVVWTKRFGLLPTRREALSDPAIVNDYRLRISAAQMLAGRQLPLGVNANRLLNAMREPLRAMLDDELTPAEAAAMMVVK